MTRLRRDICLGTLQNLPHFSIGRRETRAQQLSLVRENGFEGVMHWRDWEEIQKAGFIASGMVRILKPAATHLPASTIQSQTRRPQHDWADPYSKPAAPLRP